MTEQQAVLSWLKDAHALEVGALPTLKDHATAAEAYPDVQAKLLQHADATQRHAELIEGCITRLGGSPSALKEAVGSVIGKVTGIANLPAKDTVIKNALGDYAAEHFEIICYKSLIAAAEHMSDRETAEVCGQILRDEQEMAGWLEAQISPLTQKFLTEQTGEDDPDAPSALGSVKQRVVGLGEQGKELASNVDTKTALLGVGALLAGAGAALLVGQALRGGSGGDNSSAKDDTDSLENAYDAPATGYEAAAADMAVVDVDIVEVGVADMDAVDMGVVDMGVVAEPIELIDLPEETFDAADAAGQGAEPTLDFGLESDQGLGESFGQDDGSALMADLQGQTDVYTEVWLVPGPYSGIGPGGYDSAGDPIGQEVFSRLTQHGQVDAASIEITIDNGEVLLEGTVDSEETKRLAEEAVESIMNVNSVQNLLQVAGETETL